MSDPADCEQLNLTVPGRPASVPFLHFSASRHHVLGILEGRTYPTVPDVGSVERIVDVGANVGAASVKWAVTYPHATIHAFEPGPAALGLLERNAAHFPSIVVHRFGLGAKDEERRLYHSRWDPMSASVCASAENVATFDMITVRRAASALQSTGLTSIDLLKIDTEGCEVAILDELAAIIAGVKCLYLEYHSDADRRLIDESLSRTHLLAFASVKHPHRGDLCYVHRDSAYCRRHALLAVVHPE